MKSRISRVYGVHNMFSAEPENSDTGAAVSKRREFERSERERDPSPRSGL